MLLLHFLSTQSIEHCTEFIFRINEHQQPPHLNTKHAFGIERRKKNEVDLRIKEKTWKMGKGIRPEKNKGLQLNEQNGAIVKHVQLKRIHDDTF